MTLSPSARLEAQEAELQDEAEQAMWRGPVCVYCERDIDPTKDFRRVVGWIAGAHKDGFRRDHYEDEYAHKVCLDIDKTVGVDQMGLGL